MDKLVIGMACAHLLLHRRRATPPENDDPSDRIVQNMLDHHLIRVMGLTAGLEKRLYASVVTFLFDAFHRHVRDLDVAAFRHRLHVHMERMADATPTTFVDTDPSFFERLVQMYMDQSPSLHVWGLPRGFQRRVYANVLGLVIGVLDLVLQSVSLSILGHAFTAHVRSLTPEELTASLARAHTAPPCPETTSAILTALVDQHVRAHPIRWVPKRMHRSALFHAVRVVRALLAEIVETAHLEVLGYRVRAWFLITGQDVSQEEHKRV